MFYIDEENVIGIDGLGRLVVIDKVYFVRKSPNGDIMGVYNDAAVAESEMAKLEEQERQSSADGTRPKG